MLRLRYMKDKTVLDEEQEIRTKVCMVRRKVVRGGKETRCGLYVKHLCARLGMMVFPI